ncbi:MAG: hypothetical protein FWG92_02110 [Leptospirales bacterium]|nr:hypothetical protein [Leptospirales bacterium]
MNASKNRKSQSGQKYNFLHASAGLTKRNIHPALGKTLLDDSKGRDETSFRVICKFDGEITDVALPAMRVVDFLRGVKFD